MAGINDARQSMPITNLRVVPYEVLRVLQPDGDDLHCRLCLLSWGTWPRSLLVFHNQVHSANDTLGSNLVAYRFADTTGLQCGLDHRHHEHLRYDGREGFLPGTRDERVLVYEFHTVLHVRR